MVGIPTCKDNKSTYLSVVNVVFESKALVIASAPVAPILLLTRLKNKIKGSKRKTVIHKGYSEGAKFKMVGVPTC